MASSPDTADRAPATNPKKYSLGEPAKDVYGYLTVNRQQVIDMARDMAELTIVSVIPPDGYNPGDDLPGNNQSIGAACVNNLASKLMFMAFPPGQPMMKMEPNPVEFQEQIDQDQELWAEIALALSQLEILHRMKANTTPLSNAWNGYMKLMLVAGNALWKHVALEEPTFWPPTCYVCQRTSTGFPILSIHQERVHLTTLDEDLQNQILRLDPELEKQRDWERVATIYSVCRLVKDGGEWAWEWWQECEDEVLEGTTLTSDFLDCPQWPGWLIPVYGKNWGRGYCEEYKGDLYTLEAAGSAINDLATLAAWCLTFVKPGGTTSIRQVREAANLSVLSGNAADITTYRSEKTPDASFVANHMEAASKRVGAAFLMQSSIQRSGERVTAEEVSRLGQELDKAMGGLYTQIAQLDQLVMVNRFIRLHEEENPKIPPVPAGIEVGVVTGIDAMGRSMEFQNLVESAGIIQQVFPQQGSTILIPENFATRVFASKGVKPDGLVRKKEEVEASQQQAKQEMLQKALVEKGTAPLAKGLADAVGGQLAGGGPPGGPPVGGGEPSPQPLPPPAQQQG